jgi:histidyl-tRNA synthetase
MLKIPTRTLKGFRDFLPKEAILREKIIEKIKEIFRRFGFDPLETPALEYGDVLLGKYGQEADKLIYLFKDKGDRLVGLRYDQTVPLARVVAQYQQLPKPFKRYQIQPVWRAENPQKGRFREFLQCDIDIVGEDNLLADSEIIECALKTFRELGLNQVQLAINDRRLFGNLPKNILSSIDKLDKIGEAAVIVELITKGYQRNQAEEYISSIKKLKPSQSIKDLFLQLKQLGLKEEKDFFFKPTLVRGLDYYTGIIFEALVANKQNLSLGGGGRYDNLIELFTGKKLPAVGFAFGFDRIVDFLQENNLLSLPPTNSRFLIVYFMETKNEAVNLVKNLRERKIPTEIYLGKNLNLDKQIKYADKKGIPYVIIIGPNEVAKKIIKLKNMKTGEQVEFSQLDQLVQYGNQS